MVAAQDRLAELRAKLGKPAADPERIAALKAKLGPPAKSESTLSNMVDVAQGAAAGGAADMADAVGFVSDKTIGALQDKLIGDRYEHQVASDPVFPGGVGRYGEK